MAPLARAPTVYSFIRFLGSGQVRRSPAPAGIRLQPDDSPRTLETVETAGHESHVTAGFSATWLRWVESHLWVTVGAFFGTNLAWNYFATCGGLGAATRASLR